MASVASNLMTAEEFFDFTHRPENRDRHFELEEGELVEMPSPGERHGAVCAMLCWFFVNYTRATKRGRALANDTGIVLEREPDTVRGPDVSLYLEERNYDDLSPKYPDSLPHLVAEVLSPSDTANRMIRRLNRFLDKGVSVVWLADPEAKSISVWWQGQSPIVYDEGEEIANLPGLTDLRCKVAEIFA